MGILRTHNDVVAVEVIVKTLRLRSANSKAKRAPGLQFQLIPIDDPSMKEIVHIFSLETTTPNF
jgi:hypothetical protein